MGYRQRQVLHLEALDGLAAQLVEGDDVRHMDTPGDERTGTAHGGEETAVVADERLGHVLTHLSLADDGRQTQVQQPGAKAFIRLAVVGPQAPMGSPCWAGVGPA